MGLFGAMFAVATVIGPLIGGLCVTYLSWRWVFYINLPLGILALFVTGAVLPGHLRRVGHAIDYAGTLLLAGSATSLIIFASLGGISWAWASVAEHRHRRPRRRPRRWRSSSPSGARPSR